MKRVVLALCFAGTMVIGIPSAAQAAPPAEACPNGASEFPAIEGTPDRNTNGVVCQRVVGPNQKEVFTDDIQRGKPPA